MEASHQGEINQNMMPSLMLLETLSPLMLLSPSSSPCGKSLSPSDENPNPLLAADISVATIEMRGLEHELVPFEGEEESVAFEVKNGDKSMAFEGEKENVTAPKVGMKFDSISEVRELYRKYAYVHGFGIMTRSTKAVDNSKVKHYTLACARVGKAISTSKNPLEQKPSCKVDCKARLNLRTCKDGRLFLSGVFLEYNHDLSPRQVRHLTCNKKLNPWVKRRLDLNNLTGIPMNKNFNSLVFEAKGYENLSFGEKDCRNYIAKARQLRLGEGDIKSLDNYFIHMQNQNSNFFHIIDVDEDSRVKNVFWTDVRSQAAYECFRDVITFDTTYLTNKYDMPFAPFIGINHHGQSILLGCGLLSNENIETCIWLFKSWLACMLGNSPQAIVTDQCKAIQVAMATVFPNAKHRLCLWHILKKLPMKLDKLPQYEAMRKNLNDVVYESLTTNEFKEDWKKLTIDFNLEDNEWLASLYSDRKR